MEWMNRIAKWRANFRRYRYKSTFVFGVFFFADLCGNHHNNLKSSDKITTYFQFVWCTVFPIIFHFFFSKFFLLSSISFFLFFSLALCFPYHTPHTFRTVVCSLKMCVQVVHSKKSTQMAGGKKAISSRLNYIQFGVFVRANAMLLWCKS